jgi:hypothetical protein
MASTRREFFREAARIGVIAAQPAVMSAGDYGAPIGVSSSDSWTRGLGRHKTVFDLEDITGAPGIAGVRRTMDAYASELGARDSDLGFVVVVRHRAASMVLGSNTWREYSVGARILNLPASVSLRESGNPFLRELQGLQRRGVIILACRTAIRQFIVEIADSRRVAPGSIVSSINADILPGTIVLPNGLFGLARAQNVGCGVIRL